MTHDIQSQIAGLAREIALCDADTRARLEPRLREMRQGLKTSEPAQVRARLRDVREELDETMFDNLPV